MTTLNTPDCVQRVLDRWKAGLKIQAGYNVDLLEQIKERKLTPEEVESEEECWLDRHHVHRNDEGEWFVSDSIDRMTMLVFNDESAQWFSHCPRTGERFDGPHTQDEAEDLAELIWTG